MSGLECLGPIKSKQGGCDRGGCVERQGGTQKLGKIKILLADDNSAILKRVAQTIGTEFEVVAAVNEGSSAFRECQRLKPDVVVLDISMGEPSGIDVARQLRDSGSLSKVVFLTVHEDPDFVSAALGVGGMAYVLKSRLSADLLSAIRAALSGEVFVSPTLTWGD